MHTEVTDVSGRVFGGRAATAQQVLDRLIEARIITRAGAGGYGQDKLRLTEFGQAIVAAAITTDQAGALSSYLIRGLSDDGSPEAPTAEDAK